MPEVKKATGKGCFLAVLTYQDPNAVRGHTARLATSMQPQRSHATGPSILQPYSNLGAPQGAKMSKQSGKKRGLDAGDAAALDAKKRIKAPQVRSAHVLCSLGPLQGCPWP